MRSSYGTSPVPHFIRRGAGGKGLLTQYLACCLPYFGLAFTGPKAETEEIKRHLSSFLSEELGLTLSSEKTLITHARRGAAKFLGYEITTMHSDTKQSLTKGGVKRRSINGKTGLRVPRAVLVEKCNRYRQRGKPCHRAELLNESDYTIMATYQLEYRGIVNYYRLAYNLHTLQYLKWIMEISLTKTLAAKHQISVKAVYDKYQRKLVVDGKTYKGLQVTVPREGKKPLVATWVGVNSDEIEVHHIRALKDLNTYDGRDKPRWVKIMAARRRKTLILCQTCHRNLHAGRPLKQSVSRSRTEPLR